MLPPDSACYGTGKSYKTAGAGFILLTNTTADDWNDCVWDSTLQEDVCKKFAALYWTRDDYNETDKELGDNGGVDRYGRKKNWMDVQS